MISNSWLLYGFVIWKNKTYAFCMEFEKFKIYALFLFDYFTSIEYCRDLEGKHF